MASGLSRCGVAAAMATRACCVAGETRVRTLRGERAAASLASGDRVVSVVVASGELVARELVAVRRAVRECLALRWPGGRLVCTPDHPLWDPDRAAYRPASDWITGDARRLLACAGALTTIVEVEATEAYAGIHTVVDLSLASAPHNFVAGGVVVHNKSLLVEDVAPGVYASADIDGPAVELPAVGDQQRFRLRACLDGAADFAGGNLDVSAVVTASPTRDETSWASLAVDVETSGPTAYKLPATLGGDYPLPDDPCSGGVVFTFLHVQGPPDTGVSVTWEIAATTAQDAPEDELRALELTLEPLG